MEDNMQRTRDFLKKLALPESDAHSLPTSSRRFPDGAQYRVEIPSVEGPAALEAVRSAAQEYGVTVHRISQGSGIFLLRTEEIRAMATLGYEMGSEGSLFVRPRAGWGTGAGRMAQSGRKLGERGPGLDQMLYAVEGQRRA